MAITQLKPPLRPRALKRVGFAISNTHGLGTFYRNIDKPMAAAGLLVIRTDFERLQKLSQDKHKIRHRQLWPQPN